MRITTITVSYGETCSLPEYSNVKPSITLTAELDEDDGREQVEADLWAMARSSVREEIDAALELHGRAAKYSEEPRYQVIKSHKYDRWDTPAGTISPPYEPIVVILPNEINERFDGYVHAAYGESRNLRYHHALQVAQRVVAAEGARLVDCSDGDLSRIPSMALIAAPERGAAGKQSGAVDTDNEHWPRYGESED